MTNFDYMLALVLGCCCWHRAYPQVPYYDPNKLPSSDGRRLFETLMKEYNKLIRPVEDDVASLNVSLGIKLTQLIEVDEVDQVMVTNIWLRQQWNDYRMRWDPTEFGGMMRIQIPSEMLWTPDIVLYNNADGDYEITQKTKAIVQYDGEIIWEPPAIYRSYCLIEVAFFPYDQQTCTLKFGTWSYDGYQINLLPQLGYVDDNTTINNGIDLSEFYFSIEWDVMEVKAKRSQIEYECCPGKYIDITYTISIRRKTKFFTVNMMFPCAAISFLTVLVFYLPSDSGEKITLSISVLMSLTVFFLLLTENVPPTSLAVPLIGKYLVFTMVLVTMSTVISVAVLEIHFRNPSTHTKMAPWIRRIFIEILPPIIRVSRPSQYAPKFHHKSRIQKERERFVKRSQYSTETTDSSEYSLYGGYEDLPFEGDSTTFVLHNTYTPEVERAIESVKFIADRFRENREQDNIIQDWKYVARVIDRLFLLLFGVGCVVGTFSIILYAPSLYDPRLPIPYTRCTNFTDFSQLPGYSPSHESFIRAFICSRLDH